MRYVKIFIAQFKLALMSSAIFRVNFLLMLLQSSINTILNVVCVSFIYKDINSIAGWNESQMIILLSTALVINQIYRALVLPNHTYFLENVSSGGFDRMLLKPISLLFQINLGKVNFSSLISTTAPIIVLHIYLNRIGADIKMYVWCLYWILVILGVIALSFFMVMIQTLVFVLIKVDGIMNIYYITMSIAEKPKEIFKAKTVATLFTYLIPTIVISNLPTSILLGKIPISSSLISPAICSVFGVIATWSLRSGIRRYTSASS